MDLARGGVQMSGLVAATFMGAASALGNLSLEAILKHSVDGSQGVEQSIWLQNLVLYCYTASLTLMLWVIDVSMEHAHKNLFYGWDGKTWILLLFQVSITSITWTLYTWEKADVATFPVRFCSFACSLGVVIYMSCRLASRTESVSLLLLPRPAPSSRRVGRF